MSALTPEARGIAAEIAGRHGLSADAVETMMIAVANGNGMQAQFNHHELGGMGQWSQGGMTMVGDMFNNGLKAQVDALCSELSRVVMERRVFAQRPHAGSWSQSSSQSQSQGPHSGASSFFIAGSGGSQWPEELGFPASTGSQNDMRYGVFPSTRRLAIEVGGRVEVYDTGDHHISGVSQQQSGDRSLTFTSQHGLVRLSDLKRVKVEASGEPKETGQEASKSAATDIPDVDLPGVPGPLDNDVDPAPVEAETVGADLPESLPGVPGPLQSEVPPKSAPHPATNASADEIIALIQKLADLKAGGILTEAEFDAKKTELLSRL